MRTVLGLWILGCAGVMGCAGQAAALQEAPSEGAASRETPIVRVVRQVGPTVVNLYSNIEFRSDTFFGMRNVEAGSLGAGVIVHPSGIVVTNSHVITANIDSTALRTIDVRVNYRPRWSGPGSEKVEEYPARILAFDERNDLALLKIQADRTFPAARLGTSSDLMVGETVVAVGNPYGREGSVTHGIISATNRSLTGPTGEEFEDIIQTDTPLNAGNSGGPLFNILGELIGINQAIGADVRMGRAEGQGLAIPVDRVKNLLEQGFDAYALGHGYLGMTLSRENGGATIAAVDPKGPSDRAGLKPGDRIVSIEGQAIAGPLDFNLVVLSQAPGKVIKLEAEAARSKREVSVELVSLDETIWKSFGMEVVDDRRFPGPVIVRLAPRGPAADLGLADGDIISKLGERRTRSKRDVFEEALRAAPGKLYIQIRRSGERRPLEGEMLLRSAP